jgi:hypothetical protein
MVKLGCIVQGNVREGLEIVLAELRRHLEVVILSTWRGEEANLPEGDYVSLLSEMPDNRGLVNRNLQRVSTLAGIRKAEELECTHVMKWRTDMLPTSLSTENLLHYCRYKVPSGMSARIFMSAFRNLTVEPDWFSTFPDLFAFSDLESMKVLWSDADIDFTRTFNVPGEMIEECNLQIGADALLDGKGRDITEHYDTHVECYAYFKSNLQRKLGRKLDHAVIARDYLYLIDHHKLGICWFGEPGEFRSIGQAYHIPWWTERGWRSGDYQLVRGIGYPDQGTGWKLKGDLYSRLKVFREKRFQQKLYSTYRSTTRQQ